MSISPMFFRRAVLLLTVLALSGCGDTPRVLPGQEPCPTQTAQIRIGDGWSEILCGCQGPADGTIAVAPQSLNCTVNAGSQVIFRFEGANTPHQIASAPGATLTFRTSHPVFPSEMSLLQPYPIQLTTVGTYDYVDLFSPEQLKGTITVQ